MDYYEQTGLLAHWDAKGWAVMRAVDPGTVFFLFFLFFVCLLKQ